MKLTDDDIDTIMRYAANGKCLVDLGVFNLDFPRTLIAEAREVRHKSRIDP